MEKIYCPGFFTRKIFYGQIAKSTGPLERLGPNKDPERQFTGSITFSSYMNEPPFHWIDGAILPESERDRFTLPHIRSEFVPIYSIPMMMG